MNYAIQTMLTCPGVWRVSNNPFNFARVEVFPDKTVHQLTPELQRDGELRPDKWHISTRCEFDAEATAALLANAAGWYLPSNNPWFGCGECDVSFACHQGARQCIRQSQPVVVQEASDGWRELLEQSAANFTRQFGASSAAAWVYRDLDDLFSASTATAAPTEPVKWRTSWAVLKRLRDAAAVPPKFHPNDKRTADDLWRTVLLSDLQELLHHADQATPKAAVNDWRIDTSASRQILVYKDCSVIEAEQAHYVIGPIAAEQDDAPPGWKKTAYGWAQSGESILAAEQAPIVRSTAKQRYDDLIAGHDNIPPIERLRFFCSLAMSPQDWLDVEPLFDALTIQEQANGTPGADAERLDWLEKHKQFEARDGGYSGFFRVDLLGRETGPWAAKHGGEFDHKTLRDAIDAARDAQGKESPK